MCFTRSISVSITDNLSNSWTVFKNVCPNLCPVIKRMSRIHIEGTLTFVLFNLIPFMLSFCWFALLKISTARVKTQGESGSPWRTPLSTESTYYVMLLLMIQLEMSLWKACIQFINRPTLNLALFMVRSKKD